MTMQMTDDRGHAVLAYAGTLPFIACAALPWLGFTEVAGIGSCPDIAAAYGVAIACFLAGVHWGTHLYRSDDAPMNLLLTSNAVTVVVWLAYFIAPVAVSLAILAGAFALLLFIDLRLARHGLLTGSYIRTRRNVTTIVVVMLLLTIAAA